MAASEPPIVATPPSGLFDSPGSDSVVSSGLREEYEQLISHAIVVPRIPLNGQTMMPSLEVSMKQDLAASSHHASHKRSPLSLAQELNGGSESDTSEAGFTQSRASVGRSSAHSSSASSLSSLDLFMSGQRGVLPVPAPAAPVDSVAMPANSAARYVSQAGTRNVAHTNYCSIGVNGNSPQLQQQARDLSRSAAARTNDGSIHVVRGADNAGLGYDEDAERLEGQIDTITSDLKQCILAEFAQARTKYLQKSRLESGVERERHAAQASRLRHEMEDLRQLTSTLEDSLKHKDQVIENLTQSLNKQASRSQLQKSFGQWQVNHCNAKREAFTGKLAARHYRQCLLRKAYTAWRGILVQRWKQHVEKACQTKASDVCKQLAEKYEGELGQVHQQLDAERKQVEKLQQERSEYEATMKRAFMRGVCALNMEAMGMFRHDGTATVEE